MEELIDLLKTINGNNSQTSIITIIMSVLMLLLLLSKVYQLKNMTSCNDFKDLTKNISNLNENIKKKSDLEN